MFGGVRTRFAPSPTGPLHTGGARTALFNWLYARSRGGSFIIRIDDTDKKRSSRASEEYILNDLRWLGLAWDEGPAVDDLGGLSGPYRQSERAGFYDDYSKKLLEQGKAYYCYCTDERLSELRTKQVKAGTPPRYDRRCLEQGDIVKEPAEGACIRFLVPDEGEVAFGDAVRGELSFENSGFSDFVIMGSDGIPSYNFAAAIDDALMDITHVIRGEDHLSNTPRQILIQQALGMPVPAFCHVPLIVGPDGKPLSKREKSASIVGLREQGYLPLALINTLARLGWAPGEGFLSLMDLADLFEVGRLSKSPSIFDMGRLRDFNKSALTAAPPELVIREIDGVSEGPAFAWLLKAVEAVKGDVATTREILPLIEPLTGELKYGPEALAILETPGVDEILEGLSEELEELKELTNDTAHAALKSVAERSGKKGKQLFMPIRVALTGQTAGIEIYKILALLGKERAGQRLNKAIEKATIEEPENMEES